MSSNLKIGFVVNPNAGLGGAVGLKGTDGPDTVAEALRRGAIAQSGPRARRAMKRLADRAPGTSVVTMPGVLGQDWLEGLRLSVEVRPVGSLSGTARDTRNAVSAMQDCDLIVFAGGDGTARDVASELPAKAGLLGIPCGVKMHSGVFAVTPEAAGSVLAELIVSPKRIDWVNNAEVMDIDEEELRAGRLAPRLFSHARTPRVRSQIQASKGGPRVDWSAALHGAALGLVDEMDKDTLYIIGPGTSAGAVAKAANCDPSILGADGMLGQKLVARDATAQQLEQLAQKHPVKIVLGVTGQQGFLLGRGNQQISPALIRKAGREGLNVLATEDKLASLAQPKLWIDTGDPELDQNLSGFIRVRTGRNREMMMRIGTS